MSASTVSAAPPTTTQQRRPTDGRQTEQTKAVADKRSSNQQLKGRTKVIGPPAAPKMLVMTNKTPFWNEQSQVYQASFCYVLINLLW